VFLVVFVIFIVAILVLSVLIARWAIKHDVDEARRRREMSQPDDEIT
jgi:hypothetical protein